MWYILHVKNSRKKLVPSWAFLLFLGFLLSLLVAFIFLASSSPPTKNATKAGGLPPRPMPPTVEYIQQHWWRYQPGRKDAEQDSISFFPTPGWPASIFAFLALHITFQDISQPLFWRRNASVAESGSHGSAGWSFALFYFYFGVSK